MTADANTDLIRQAFAAQVYSVIPKPVSANVVLHTLERALAKVYGVKYEPKPERPTEKPEANNEGAPKTKPGDRGGETSSRPSVN
jgi:DNA-binding NtrC family response regulator